MKSRLLLNALVLVSIVIAGIGGSCRHQPPNNDSNINRPTNVNRPPVNVNNVNSNGDGPKTDNGNQSADSYVTMIVYVDNIVTMKAKDATDFVRIYHTPFFVGDLLRVADSSTAWADCGTGVLCPLGKGDYTQCCRTTCENSIALRPPNGTQVTPYMSKVDLPLNARQALETSEKRIRALGADEVTTQYLVANLYSSWKVAEANQEVDKLSQKLKTTDAPQKLDRLYLPMLNRTGDMYLKMDKKGPAEESYKKVVVLAPQSKDEETKAAAHVSLGEIYRDSGRKTEAIQNLQQGQRLYEKHGDVKKAAEVRQAIVKVQDQ